LECAEDAALLPAVALVADGEPLDEEHAAATAATVTSDSTTLTAR